MSRSGVPFIGVFMTSAVGAQTLPVSGMVSYLGTEAPVSCVGDCDGGGEATVDEILILVNIALGNADVSECPHGVPSGDQVSVALILQAANNALKGCPRQ